MTGPTEDRHDERDTDVGDTPADGDAAEPTGERDIEQELEVVREHGELSGEPPD